MGSCIIPALYQSAIDVSWFQRIICNFLGYTLFSNSFRFIILIKLLFPGLQDHEIYSACLKCLLITFANCLDSDQARHNIGHDLNPHCLILMVFMKELQVGSSASPVCKMRPCLHMTLAVGGTFNTNTSTSLDAFNFNSGNLVKRKVKGRERGQTIVIRRMKTSLEMTNLTTTCQMKR